MVVDYDNIVYFLVYLCKNIEKHASLRKSYAFDRFGYFNNPQDLQNGNIDENMIHVVCICLDIKNPSASFFIKVNLKNSLH